MKKSLTLKKYFVYLKSKREEIFISLVSKISMNFNVKLDDKKLKVNIENTNLKDVLIYCKPKERLVLTKKFGLGGEK